jgi:hypothetical protein
VLSCRLPRLNGVARQGEEKAGSSKGGSAASTPAKTLYSLSLNPLTPDGRKSQWANRCR